MKKFLAVFLAAIMLVSMIPLANTVFKASAVTYTPRLTAPSKSDSHYYSGNIFYQCGYGMPNCTCYAFGRAWELLGSEPRVSHGNAGSWYFYNKKYGYYAYGSTPKLGAIACWDRYDENRGHVAVVEKINSDGTVTLSESHYQGTNFTTKIMKADGSNYLTNYRFLGYIYILEGYVEPPAPPEQFKTIPEFKTPVKAYPRATSGVITVYDSNLSAYPTSSRYIAYNDLCTINEIYSNGYCSVTYPTATGTNTAYAKSSDFIANAVSVPYTWSPSTNLNAYTRADMKTQFGSVFTTDSCAVVGQSGNNLQVIYPVSSGGYKMGWVNSSYTPVAPEATRPSVTIPGPVASGAFSGKSIVAVAPKKITFSSTAYISAGDTCILTNVNPNTGYCTVQYPSGSNDVFTAKTVRTQTVAINEFINYNGSAQAEVAQIPNQLTAYPTQSMTNTVGSYTSNWWLDPGDTYTTINNVNGATEVLYYCNQGKHNGYWKLGWVWLDYYTLDLNGYLDNSSKGNLGSYGTADIYVNGIKRADDVSDFCISYPKGSTYEIKDVRAYKGYTYNGVQSGSAAGTLTGNASVSLNFTKNPVTVSNIVVTSNPAKTTYLEGESLNTSGLVVTANYSDGTNKNVTSSCTFSGYSSTPGDKTVTVSFGGKTTSFGVYVKSKSPAEISIATKPSKTTYFVGDKLDLSGLSVKAKYDNGTSATVTDYSVLYAEDITDTAGTKTVMVTYIYNDVTKTASFNVTVTDVDLSGIAVKTSPAKTTYYVGDSLNTSGLTLTATYNNGATQTVSSGFTCTPTVLSTAGTQKITVTYGGKSTSFNVTVTDIALSGITVKANPAKTSYFVGDTLNTSGLALAAKYNNGTTQPVSSGFTCTPTALNTAGTQKITVTYGGKTANFNVTVNDVALSGIAVKTNPAKTTYYVGDTLNTSGLTLTATYNNGTTQTVSSGFTCTPTALNTAGTQKITVTFGGYTTYFSVTVVAVYTVKFDPNGGNSNPKIYTITDTVTVPDTIPTKDGYEFIGWAKTPDATDAEYYCGEILSITEDTTFYAVWEEIVIPETPEEPETPETPEEPEIPEKPETPPVIEYSPEIMIRKPSTSSISYGDSIILHAETEGELPAGATIKWEASNGIFDMNVSSDGKTCKISSVSNGTAKITAKIVDADGETISSDELIMGSDAGFLAKLIAFFKSIFGLTRTIPQIFRG